MHSSAYFFPSFSPSLRKSTTLQALTHDPAPVFMVCFNSPHTVISPVPDLFCGSVPLAAASIASATTGTLRPVSLYEG